jgi:hypothetical protein
MRTYFYIKHLLEVIDFIIITIILMKMGFRILKYLKSFGKEELEYEESN